MIDFEDAEPGQTVFYQQRHMPHPEYGMIVSTNLAELPRIRNQIVRVRFLGDDYAKPCHPADLYYPPNFCAIDGGNQKYSDDWPRYKRCSESR